MKFCGVNEESVLFTYVTENKCLIYMFNFFFALNINFLRSISCYLEYISLYIGHQESNQPMLLNR